MKDGEQRGRLEHEALTEQVIGAAIDVHRELGPGLLESAYEACLACELPARGVSFCRQVELPVVYQGNPIDCGYRLDFVVESAVVLELKSIDRVLRIHEAQLLTYLRLSGLPVGLLLNFNVMILKDGILRRANTQAALRALRDLRGDSDPGDAPCTPQSAKA